MAASLLGLFNRLLPFATPGTPITQDLLHLAALCGLLYYAPRIQEWLQNRHSQSTESTSTTTPEQGSAEIQRDPGTQHAEPQHIIQPHHDPHRVQPPRNAAIEDADDSASDNDNDDNDDNNDGEPGPARPRDVPAPRNVGAKKAKSLARRDQRRAYHEFQRSQGEIQRARDAEGATERDAALAAERERRRAAAAALEAKKAKERDQKREAEKRSRLEDARRREQTVEIVRTQLNLFQRCDLSRVARQVGGDVDDEWVERIVASSGLLDRRETEAVTMITGMGWAVRVTAQDMARTYEAVLAQKSPANDIITFDDIGRQLERQLLL